MMECGICLEKIKLDDTSKICQKCEKAVHINCWNQWEKSSGRCIYCNNQIIEKEDMIVSADYGMEFSTMDYLEDLEDYNSSSDEDFVCDGERIHIYPLRSIMRAREERVSSLRRNTLMRRRSLE